MNLWRKLFPKYKCKWCRDTGVQSDGRTIAACRHCRDIDAEVKAMREKLAFCQCKPLRLSSQGGAVCCDHCGIKWGTAAI